MNMRYSKRNKRNSKRHSNLNSQKRGPTVRPNFKNKAATRGRVASKCNMSQFHTLVFSNIVSIDSSCLCLVVLPFCAQTLETIMEDSSYSGLPEHKTVVADESIDELLTHREVIVAELEELDAKLEERKKAVERAAEKAADEFLNIREVQQYYVKVAKAEEKKCFLDHCVDSIKWKSEQIDFSSHHLSIHLENNNPRSGGGNDSPESGGSEIVQVSSGSPSRVGVSSLVAEPSLTPCEKSLDYPADAEGLERYFTGASGTSSTDSSPDSKAKLLQQDTRTSSFDVSADEEVDCCSVAANSAHSERPI